MKSNNQVMFRNNFVPAPEVAKKLRKPLSSVHRLVADGYLRGARDGTALYVDLASLEKYYQNSPPMLAAVRELEQWLKSRTSSP